MQATFKKILVPVDFTVNSEMAIRKAIDLIDRQGSVMVLVHILKPLFSLNIFSSAGFIVSPASEILSRSEMMAKFRQYEHTIKSVSENIRVEIIITEVGPVQRNIIQIAKYLAPDLIIISKTSNGHLLPISNKVSPARIAKKSGCPVLTIKQGSSIHAIRNIVLPVNDTIPDRKLEMAVMMAKKFNARVHLVTFSSKSNTGNETEHALIESFLTIKESIPLMLKHGALKGRSLAKATLSYAELINADMILANAGTESSISFLSVKRHLSDLLLRTSPIQIMDIEPHMQTK